MSIDPTRSSGIRTGAAQQPSEVEGVRPAKAAESRPAGDQVEISDAARALAEKGGPEALPFTEARASEVKERLESGFYERPEVIEETAKRLLDSGDL